MFLGCKNSIEQERVACLAAGIAAYTKTVARVRAIAAKWPTDQNHAWCRWKAANEYSTRVVEALEIAVK